MAHPSSLLRSLAAAALLTLVMAATVAGYAGQVAATITATAVEDSVTCGTPITVSALIQDAADDPIGEQPVTWSLGLGAIAGDAITDTATDTNAQGIASTGIRLACGERRQVTVVISADDVEGSLVLQTDGQGLPRTDTTPLADDTALPGVLLAALAVLVGSGAILHRFATERR